MPNQIQLGRYPSAIAMIALGGIGLLFANFLMEWTPAPAQLPARAACYLHGSVLTLAGSANAWILAGSQHDDNRSERP